TWSQHAGDRRFAPRRADARGGPLSRAHRRAGSCRVRQMDPITRFRAGDRGTESPLKTAGPGIAPGPMSLSWILESGVAATGLGERAGLRLGHRAKAPAEVAAARVVRLALAPAARIRDRRRDFVHDRGRSRGRRTLREGDGRGEQHERNRKEVSHWFLLGNRMTVEVTAEEL